MARKIKRVVLVRVPVETTDDFSDEQIGKTVAQYVSRITGAWWVGDGTGVTFRICNEPSLSVVSMESPRTRERPWRQTRTNYNV
jgi:hypothetical protein